MPRGAAQHTQQGRQRTWKDSAMSVPISGSVHEMIVSSAAPSRQQAAGRGERWASAALRAPPRRRAAGWWESNARKVMRAPLLLVPKRKPLSGSSGLARAAAPRRAMLATAASSRGSRHVRLPRAEAAAARSASRAQEISSSSSRAGAAAVGTHLPAAGRRYLVRCGGRGAGGCAPPPPSPPAPHCCWTAGGAEGSGQRSAGSSTPGGGERQRRRRRPRASPRASRLASTRLHDLHANVAGALVVPQALLVEAVDLDALQARGVGHGACQVPGAAARASRRAPLAPSAPLGCRAARTGLRSPISILGCRSGCHGAAGRWEEAGRAERRNQKLCRCLGGDAGGLMITAGE